MKVLKSRNRVRGFVADIMRKRIINFVSQNEVHSGMNLRGKVMIRVFQISRIWKRNRWLLKMKMREI